MSMLFEKIPTQVHSREELAEKQIMGWGSRCLWWPPIQAEAIQLSSSCHQRARAMWSYLNNKANDKGGHVLRPSMDFPHYLISGGMTAWEEPSPRMCSCPGHLCHQILWQCWRPYRMGASPRVVCAEQGNQDRDVWKPGPAGAAERVDHVQLRGGTTKMAVWEGGEIKGPLGLQLWLRAIKSVYFHVYVVWLWASYLTTCVSQFPQI